MYQTYIFLNINVSFLVKQSNWTFLAADLGEDSFHMHVLDLNGNGNDDVISASVHKYGIRWHNRLKMARAVLPGNVMTLANYFLRHKLQPFPILKESVITTYSANAASHTTIKILIRGLMILQYYIGLNFSQARSLFREHMK